MQGITHAALSHEFTHFVEELSAEKFRKFTDVLFDVLGKSDVDVNRLIEAKEAVLRNTEEYKGRSEKELRAIAYSEAVAEMMEPVLTDTDAISRISQKIKQQDRSLWEKIKDFIKGIVEKLKAAYRDMEPDSAIARLTRETVTNSEAVLDAFSEAAADAVLNYNLQETAKENGLRYSDGTFTNRNGEPVDYLKSARITDKETLDFLNDQETVTTYKTMQLVDGKLYPPMAAVIQGSYEDASELGKWEMAVEHPELIKDVNGKAKFTLNKGKGQGSLAAAYNPYMHSSNLVLNDQFSGAYLRPNLVTVECKVPVSELTSGYKAQYAKDSVGWHSWHTGTVAGALRQQTGVERQVLLSRYIMPVRILSNAEVAGMYAELLNGTEIAVPDNVVPPALLAELKKAGVTIKESGKVQAEGQKNNARAGVTETGVRYSSRKLSEQIDEIANQTFDRNNHVNYGSTPRALSNILSLPILPMLGTYTHAYTMALSQQQAQEEGRKTRGLNFHDLGWDMVKNIPDMLNHPAAIIKSNTDVNDSRFVVVTNQVDKNGNPIIAAIAPKGTGQYYSLDVPGSILLSGYGKDSFSNYLNRAKTENRVLWVDKNNHQKQASPGVQFPNALLSGDYSNNLAQFKKIVKGEFVGTIFQNTFDNDGNRRFSSRDSEYLNLAQNPEENREALSRMVENAAREAGYDSPMLYHGTQSFGFTNFDLDKMDDKLSIFLTSNPDIAATYSGVDGSRNIGKASGTDINTLSLQEVAQMMNQFPPESGMDYQYSVVESKAEISGQVDRGLNELNNLINTLKKQYGKDSKEYGRLEKLQNTLYLGTNDGLSTQLWMILKQTDLFKGHEDFVNGLEQNLRLLKKAPESGSFLVEKALGGYSIDVLSEADAKEELEQNMQRGNYALYARLGNTLTVEGEGQRWNNLKNWAKGMEVDENSTYVMEDDGKFFLLRKADDSVVENGVIEATEKARELSPDALQFLLIQKANTSLRILTEVATTTRDVTKWAKNAGYDSVIFKNIKDSGGQNNGVSMDTTADIYAIFNPNDAKSADAVTYDDNGNVIPLSQRFDTGKEDIRYSARYAAAEENPEIAKLVQRVLSGDFKANDKVYLGTVSQKNAARIQEITGINVDGFRVAIEARQIEHILNRHGIEGSENHSMAQVSDISKIQYTLDNPDSIIPAGKTSAYVYMRNGKNRTADTVLYEKDIGGKSYYTVQAIADTKAKTLYVVSAFIGESGYKKGTPQFTNAKSLGATSETAAVDVPTGNVAQSGTDVKGKKLESRRVSQEVRDAIEEYRRQQDVQSKAYRQMYERQLEEVKKSYQKQISSMESEYSANLAQIQDAFFQTVEAYEKGQFRNEHLEKVLKQAAETQRAQAKASEADNATWEKEFNRLLRAYETSGRNVQRLKQTVENQRARAKAKVEAARVTEQRGKLYRAVNEINRRLLNPTKTLYVPDSLAPAVTKFMQGLTEAMESPKNSWNVQGALETLQEQYRKLTQMNEGVFTQEYNQGILDLLDNAISAVGGTDFNKLSASQIEDVYSAVRSVLTAIRNENKMFAANLNKTYAEAAEAVRREEEALPNRKPTTGAVQDKAEKFGWNQLKPVYAMMRLGSDTLLKQYNNLRAGEDKWQRTIAAARAYGLGIMEKYHYDQWNDSLMKLDTETGTVELSLEERMSLYAYARREQAFEHLTKGGFVLSDKNTRTVKNRFGIKTEQI